MKFLVTHYPNRDAIKPRQLQAMQRKAPGFEIKIIGRDRRVTFEWTSTNFDHLASHRTQFAVFADTFWLLGRIRLDARMDLLAALAADDPATIASRNDAMLVLQAYEKWGVGCVEHLLGDYCFVIWDDRRQSLFCARDHLGVRPLFSSQRGGVTMVSDSLSRITQCSSKNTLDRYWIADFLIQEYSRDGDRTVYSNIRRLPAGHSLRLINGGLSVTRYWDVGNVTPLYFASQQECCEQFRQLLAAAIADRLPKGRIGISLSGGLDSSTMLAETITILGGTGDLSTNTYIYEKLIPDDERQFVELIGKTFNFRPEFTALDCQSYDPEWQTRKLNWPEPSLQAINAQAKIAIDRNLALRSGVWFEGEGPDNALLFEWRAYLAWLARTRQWPRLFKDAGEYILGKPAAEWAGNLRGLSQRIRGAVSSNRTGLLDWAVPQFATETGLAHRISAKNWGLAPPHPWHPRTISSFRDPIWSSFFETYEPTFTGTPLEWRHPFVDLRVLNFMLSLPPIPWGRQKFLLREAMRTTLSREVLSRRKTPLQGDPVGKMLQRYPLPKLTTGPVEEFINLGRLPDQPQDPEQASRVMRIHVLDNWLRTAF